MKKISQLLREFFKDDKQINKRKYIIVIALVGVLFILISNMFDKKDDKPQGSLFPQELVGDEPDLEEVALLTSVTTIEETYEKDLQAMLNQIQGVSEVEVMVNIDSTNKSIYEKDEVISIQSTDESDKNGGIRKVEDQMKETKLVYVRQGDQEVPLLIQTTKPEVRGVFVIAKGVEDATVKMWIIDSVSKVLDVPTYRISVMPK